MATSPVARITAALARRASGRNVLLLLVVALAVFSLFGQVLNPAFQAATAGHLPIDMSFPTTPAVIYQQELPYYTPDSVRVYRWFFLLDFFWPPLLATFLGLLWCWLASLTRHPLPGRMLAAGVIGLPYAEALLDLTENVGFLIIIEAWPRVLPGLAWVAGTVKHTKIFLVVLCLLVTLMFAGLAVVRRRGSGS